jgi:DDE superfamily endonuclease
MSRHTGSPFRSPWGRKGCIPVQCGRMSLTSAVTIARPHAVHDQGERRVDAEVFIEFVRRLMCGDKDKIFLIVDRGPAHVGKKITPFVSGLRAKLRLYLRPHSQMNWSGSFSKPIRSGVPH